MSAKQAQRRRRVTKRAPAKSAFQSAVQACKPEEVAASYESGKQALKGEHRPLVTHSDNRFTGSIDLDKALTEASVQGRKWDYGIGYMQGATEACVWVEVHPATVGEVDVMLEKLDALRAWLREGGGPLLNLTRACPDPFVWLSTDSGVPFGRTAPKARKMLTKGLRFPERHLALPMP